MDERKADGSLGAGSGGGSGGGQGGGRGDSDSSSPSEPKPDAPKPAGLFSDVPAARPDSTAELGQEPIEPIEPDSSSGAQSDGVAAERPTARTETTDSSRSGGIAGLTDARAEEARRATGAGTEANTAESSALPRSQPLDPTEPAADRGTGAERSLNPDITGSSEAESAAYGGGGARGRTTTATDIEIPLFDIDELEADGVLLEQAEAIREIRVHPISGIWEQIDGPNTSDFAPGGYQRSVIALHPARKTITVYRLFRGDVAMVVGGELTLDCDIRPESRAAGTLSVRADPSVRSRFRTTSLPLGGEPPITMEPPSGSGPWPYEWKREHVQLVIGEKRYAAITREAFDKIRSGGGDVATAADASERIPARRPGERGIDAKETSFFGIRGGGKRICFIVDMSGSMAGLKFDRLKHELTQTLEGFDEKQFFSVAFFDGTAQVLDQSWMQAGADRIRAVQLVTQQATGGGTDPTQAFEFAFQTLSPIPDCIFFMTDGQIPPSIPDLIRALNSAKNPTIIHTINFGEPASEGMMRQIAQEHGGTHTFIQP